ncbi:MAG: PH domain-containing protein [Coriobacteriales bacterium]|jgi:membrane protein YdbS with pleckstrin-like domain|nr:PH domain-containing protein [Coriobacteriales bacterium]
MRELPSERLDRRIVRVWRLTATINVLLWCGICVLAVGFIWALAQFNIVQDFAGAAPVLGIVLAALIALTVVLFIVCVIVVPKVRHLRWRYQVYPEEVDILRGILWRTRLIIPLIRVQNVDTKQGPIMRLNGLASVTIATAAGEHEIPGLGEQQADALRDQVAVLARMAQEDV